MGKMLVVLAIIFLIEISVGLFIEGSIFPAVSGPDKTSFFSWLFDPTLWSSSGLLSFITNNLLLLGGTATIAAGAVLFKNDFLVYSGIALVLFSFGQVLFTLYQHMTNLPFMDPTSMQVVTIFSLFGIFVYFLNAMLDYPRGRD